MGRRRGKKSKRRRYSRRRKSILSLLGLTRKRRRLISNLLVCLLVFVTLIYGRQYFNLSRFSGPRGDFRLTSLVGIDVSHYQGNIEWNKLTVKSLPFDAHASHSVGFVIAKASEGKDVADSRYAVYKSSAIKHNIPFGAYHYFKPNTSSVLQASFFMKRAQLSSGNIVPVLDVEEHGRLSVQELQKRVLEWLGIVESYYGRTPIIYCNLSYYTKYFSGPKFKRYPFWIASYSRRPKNIDNAVLWQCSDRGRVDGIKSKVDIDIYLKDEDSFSRLLL